MTRMGILKKLFGKSQPTTDAPPEHAVIVQSTRINTENFNLRADEVAALEESLTGRIEESGVGEFDGNEVGPEDYTLYMYGSDAEALFIAVEDILRQNAITSGGVARVRSGPPGTPERIVSL